MPSSYVKPVVGEVKRLDQGIDFQGTPGDTVSAMGLARVDAVKDDPGGFGKVVYYTLLDGPNKGQQIYVGHAAPTVHPGKIVNAGDPVATLLEHGLGNASNLAGWTEVGFAKGGVPEANSAKRFQAFVDKAGVAVPADVSAAPASPAPVSAAPVDQTGTQPYVPTVTTQAPPAGPPAPESTQAFQPAPGSGMYAASTGQMLADEWNRIASQPGASPDSLLLAQNAALLGG